MKLIVLLLFLFFNPAYLFAGWSEKSSRNGTFLKLKNSNETQKIAKIAIQTTPDENCEVNFLIGFNGTLHSDCEALRDLFSERGFKAGCGFFEKHYLLVKLLYSQSDKLSEIFDTLNFFEPIEELDLVHMKSNERIKGIFSNLNCTKSNTRTGGFEEGMYLNMEELGSALNFAKTPIPGKYDILGFDSFEPNERDWTQEIQQYESAINLPFFYMQLHRNPGT